MLLNCLIIVSYIVGWSSVGPYVVPAVDIPSWCYFLGITCDIIPTSATYRSVKAISYALYGDGRLLSASFSGIRATAVSATLPSIITNFINMEELALIGFYFTGTIPASIYGMSALTIIDLSINSLTGTIDSAISTATRLVGLFLSQNLLGGTIPSTIGSMGSLTALYLDSNSLTGTIPDNIGNIGTQLRDLSLGFNLLSGTIPSTFDQLALGSFSLDTNYLTMGSLATVPVSTFSAYTIAHMNGYELSNNCLVFSYGNIEVFATHCKPTAGKVII